MKKNFAIIGMGRFGSSVAKALRAYGHDVLAIDASEQRIQEMSAVVTHSVQADTTDEEALKALGIRNFDVVVVAIGEDIQASILTTLILKELGVPVIIAKAKNELHGKVLGRIGADRVIYPERDMGLRVAHNLISPNILEYIEISDDYSIAEIKATPKLVGKSLRQLDIRAKFQCNVMAIKHGDQEHAKERMNITPSPDHEILESDVLVIVGRNEDLWKFEKAYAE
ncbi:potassium transporter Trk [Paenibacillus sp. J31TS4]|uniref:potassium channel family protein n=1 Tax=Paenibacillus sp. J31TS4 TaxID=2807195 RepID=UPI001B08F1FF|nr:TrkA family potassium uptake protein [Paenibacillus sp. J31TS4]GIP40847.1 potassium transporter Trk [Paenibacillus sp. J31TS4]